MTVVRSLCFLAMDGAHSHIAFLHGEQLVGKMVWFLVLIGSDVFLVLCVKKSRLTRERKVLALVLILALSAIAYAFLPYA